MEYTYLKFKYEKNNTKSIQSEASFLSNEIKKFSDETDKKEKSTITDLEAYIVVKERLRDASESLRQSIEFSGKNETERALRSLSYASERLTSAYSWSRFFGMKGKEFYIDNQILRQSCQNKINEATERKQYVELYIPSLDNIQRQIHQASEELKNENYGLCLSIASKAQADVDVILGIFGVEESQYGSIAERKLEIARNNIARQSSKGIFPILGYSYYEYAASLKESDVLSSLLYSEYSLELGNLDIYFKQKKKLPLPKIDSGKLGIFISGFFAGIAVILIISPFRKKNQK